MLLADLVLELVYLVLNVVKLVTVLGVFLILLLHLVLLMLVVHFLLRSTRHDVEDQLALKVLLVILIL